MRIPSDDPGAVPEHHGAAMFVTARLAGLVTGGGLYCGWMTVVVDVCGRMSHSPDIQAGRPMMITVTAIAGVLGGLSGPVIWWLSTIVVWRITGHPWRTHPHPVTPVPCTTPRQLNSPLASATRISKKGSQNVKATDDDLIRWKMMADYAATLAGERRRSTRTGAADRTRPWLRWWHQHRHPRVARDAGAVPRLGDSAPPGAIVVQTEYDTEASLAIKTAAVQAGWRIDEEWGGRCGFVSEAARIFLRFRWADAPPKMEPTVVDYAMFTAGDGSESFHLVDASTSAAEQVRILVEYFETYATVEPPVNRHVM